MTKWAIADKALQCLASTAQSKEGNMMREKEAKKWYESREGILKHWDALRRYIKGGDNMSNDPWEHRSKGMRCATCMWYVQKAKAESSKDMAPIGRCRRHAPTMNGYPVVFETDWCGDHKLDENAL